jgi:hypothetical protein
VICLQTGRIRRARAQFGPISAGEARPRSGATDRIGVAEPSLYGLQGFTMLDLDCGVWSELGPA